MDARNAFDHSDAVKPAVYRGAALSGDRLDVEIPVKSVVALESI